jgi:cytochrome c-type biogenesis protein CcmH/NrfG
MTAPALRSTGAAAAEDELLAQLGLPPSASPEDVDETHYAVSQFLAAAPDEIQGWAHAQAAALDRAYLTLTDPVGLQGSALRSPAGPPAVVPGGPATPPARRDPAPAVAPDERLDDVDDVRAAADDAASDEGSDEPDLSDFEALYASVTPSAHEDMRPDPRPARSRATAPAAPGPQGRKARSAAQPTAPVPTPKRTGSGPLRKAVVGTLSIAAVLAIAVGGYSLGGGGEATAANASPAATSVAPAVDQAKVGELMTAYQADPTNVETLMTLADEFYAGGLYDEASGWLDKVLALEPENTRALLARGAVAFNRGDTAAAETTWKQVVALDPDNVEAHYDLGFLYLNSATPDWAGLQREWNEVIRLDPESDLAKTVQAHLTSLEAASMLPSASGAPAASPSAGPAATPVASPAASPAGSVAP